MIIRIARKEFTEMIRDGRFQLAGAIVFSLLVVALLTGWKRYVDVSRQHAVALQTQRDLWLGQGAKNPHSAAHYGYYAFKPKLALSALDQGLDPYLGISLFLEAHKQNTANYRPVEEATPVQRFGELTAAATLQGLIPLLILALTFNLVASEKDDGTLQMLLSNRVRLRKIVLGKVAARALIIFLSAIVFSLAGFALSGAGIDGVGAIPRLLLWVCAVTAYGAFWFALSVAINALGKSAATNALALAACYLAFVVVIPSLVNLGATTFYPVPSRIEFVNAMRAETQEANRKGSQLLGKYFEDHPELAKPQDTKSPFSKTGEDDFAMLSMAKDELVARQMKPLLERFDAQLNHQHQLVNRFRYVSPAILMQSLLYNITGVGVERYQHFLRQVDEYHQSWRRYFSPRVFEKRALTSGDLAGMPQFQFAEESVGAVIRRASWPGLAMVLLTTLIGYVGLRGYRRFPVVS